MTEPTLRLLLPGLPSKMVSDPEFCVEGIEPKHRGPFVREVYGRLAYVNFTQVFRRDAGSPADVGAAREAIERDLVRALNWGIQRLDVGGAIHQRLTAGLEFLEEFVGAPIDPAFCRLAVLRPFEVRHFPRREPTRDELRKAADLGVELVASPEKWEVLLECGLDVVRRPSRR